MGSPTPFTLALACLVYTCLIHTCFVVAEVRVTTFKAVSPNSVKFANVANTSTANIVTDTSNTGTGNVGNEGNAGNMTGSSFTDLTQIFPQAIRINVGTSQVNSIIKDVMPFVLESVKTTPIDPISGSYLGLEYKVGGIQISNLSVSQAKVSFHQKDFGLNIVLGVSIHMDWQYGKWGIGSSGRAHADANATATAKIKLGTFNGVATMNVESLQVTLGKFDLRIEGSYISQVYNMLLYLFQNTLESTVAASLSTNVKQVLQDSCSEVLKQLFVSQPVEGSTDVSINYGLVSAPTYPNGLALQMDFYGGLLSKKYPAVPSFPTHPLNIPPLFSKMFTMIVDQYLLNEAGYVLHNAKLLYYIMYAKDVPPDSGFVLNTRQFKKILPKLYKMCPDKPMQLEFVTNYPPIFDIADVPKFTLDGDLLIECDKTGDGMWKQAAILTLVNSGSFDIKPNVTNSLGLSVTLQKLKVNVSVKSSNIGKFAVSVFSKITQFAVNNFLLSRINPIPIDLPSVHGATFLDPDVRLQSGTVAITANIKFTGFGDTKKQ